MRHICRFSFEKLRLFTLAPKKEILSAISDVFREACSAEYGNVTAAAQALGARGIEVCVVFTDDEGIRKYNREYRDIDRPTDVLSFPSMNFADGEGSVTPFDIDPNTGYVYLGDIVISVPKARAQAESYGHSLKREIAFLAAHSCLHLIGYDHEEDGGAKKMEALQEAILTKLGITRDAP